MNAEDIQARVNAMTAAMVAKGLRAPDANYAIKSESDPSIVLSHGKLIGASAEYDRDYHFFTGATAGVVLDMAVTFIAGLPDAAERHRADFMAQLGKTIELGRRGGIEVDYVNPLVETMKRLSENALTYQPAQES